MHHLSTAFLFTHGISHGVNLEHNHVLQYLFYIAQVWEAVPLRCPCYRHRPSLSYLVDPRAHTHRARYADTDRASWIDGT